MKKMFAVTLGLAMTLGFAAKAMADDMDTSYKATVNVDVIDANNMNYQDRIRTELVERPAPQVGQTRAAIESLYGPAMKAMAPGKDYDIYTNEADMVDGKMFKRALSQTGLRVFEVSYNNDGPNKSANDKAVDVKLRVIPRVGDNRNLVEKLLGAPVVNVSASDKGHVIYGIPQERFAFYNDVISSPHKAINAYYNAQGDLVGQEFLPMGYQGGTALSSAHRFIEFESKAQPDTKVGW